MVKEILMCAIGGLILFAIAILSAKMNQIADSIDNQNEVIMHETRDIARELRRTNELLESILYKD